MPSFRECLGGLSSVQQYIVFKLTPKPDIPGKYGKQPFNAHTRRVCGGNIPADWLSFDEAMVCAQGLTELATEGVRYVAGFYFTSDCGYWCLDADSIFDENGEWYDIPKHIWQTLHGCMWEFSSSGQGYHIIGQGALTDARQIRADKTCLELYTSGRGIAFGGHFDEAGYFGGNADHDAVDLMHSVVIPTYFPPKPTSADGVWQGKVRDDYSCISDDDELLQRMLRSGSVGSKFNVSRPIFSDLWTRNLPVIEPYYGADASRYDMALAQHLAFWTGCDPERMEKFMRLSSLARPKWDEHKTYLREFTIAQACRNQGEVLHDKPSAALAKAAAIPKELLSDDPVTGGHTEVALVEPEDQNFYSGKLEQQHLFQNCVYILDEHRIYTPVGTKWRTLNFEQFNAKYAQHTFKINNRNASGSEVKKAAEAFLKSILATFPKVDFATFNPTKPPLKIYEDEGALHMNSYTPRTIVTKEGDASPFIDLIRKNYPNGDDAVILLSWMAACVQNPGKKFMWSPVLQGGQGIGKTTITDCLRYAVGPEFVVTPKGVELCSKFNAWLEHALLVIINEMKQDKDTVGELKKLVTDKDVIIEAKGKDHRMSTNYANFIFTLNEKRDFKKHIGDRRFCVMYSALQEASDLAAAGMDNDYFTRLQDWLNDEDGYAIVAHYLSTLLVDVRYNPAAACKTAPASSSEAEVLENSRSTLEVGLRDAITDGVEGFRNGWICSVALSTAFPNVRDVRSLTRILKELQYVPHPALPDGRTTVVMARYGKKVRLYCTEEVAAKTGTCAPEDVVRAYEDGQYDALF